MAALPVAHSPISKHKLSTPSSLHTASYSMTWMPVLVALASALLAALGYERTRRRRPSLKTLEQQHFQLFMEPKAKVSKASVEATRYMSPDKRRRPLEARQAHLPSPPTPRSPDMELQPVERSLLRLIARFLLQFTGVPLLLMVSPDADNLPIDAMPSTDQDAVLEPSPMDELALEPVTKLYNEDQEQCEAEDGDEGDIKTETTVPCDAFFDGLQFYKVLTTVGRGAVQTAVSAAVARVSASKRPRKVDSIAIIRERYPDFICLLPTATHPTRAAGHRMDLRSALQLSTQAASSAARTCRHKRVTKCDACGHKDDEQARAPALASPREAGGGGFLRVA